jgi:23S rRNA (cytidine1920-2'-O)/16S rRNA (cytidine1409-2'-O)-methyltransferase
MAGKVRVNDITVEKPGTLIYPGDTIDLKEEPPYVSRGGLKLREGLAGLNMHPEGRICLDIGASTGGFTDCLLQNGARKVFSVDVGYGQLAWKLRNDSRVEVIERTNIRNMPLSALPCSVDLVTIDVSFISLKLVVPAVLKFMKKNAAIIALIKPQFEVGKGKVGKGGVVRNPELHEEVIRDLTGFFKKIGLSIGRVHPSPLLGPKGNKEFFISLKYKNP